MRSLPSALTSQGRKKSVNRDFSASHGFGAGRWKGFTLLELMLVLVIIALMVRMAALAIPDGEQKSLRNSAARFEKLFQALLDEAEIENTHFGVLINDEGYSFVRYSANEQRWLNWQERPFTAQPFLSHWQISLSLNPKDQPELLSARRTGVNVLTADDDSEESDDQAQDSEQLIEPQLMILADGEATPFELTLQGERFRARVALADEFSREVTVTYDELY